MLTCTKDGVMPHSFVIIKIPLSKPYCVKLTIKIYIKLSS